MPRSKADNRATMKYNKKAYRRFTFYLRNDDDKEIITLLENKESIGAYIKSLLLNDLKNKF